ncbi:MAG: Permease [Bryobacterales bacterium]|nr:Permease [Bryobacterales bacterium]
MGAFRYACRALRRTPGFTIVAILLLALGIGANTAVFSVIYAVLLRSLPYPQPEQLVQLVRVGGQDQISVPEYEFSKEHASSFASVAGYRGGGDQTLAIDGTVEWINVLSVTTDFLRTLGVAPALGREFQSGEVRPGGPNAIVLSDALWRRAFGGNPDVVGRVVTLNDTSYTVIGVLAPNFWFPQTALALVPLQSIGSVGDVGSNTTVIARPKPGVSSQQATAEMLGWTEGLRQANTHGLPDVYRGLMTASYQERLAGDAVRTNLLLLFGAVSLLLLIACANLASLLLARIAARQKEIAVCMALGSSSGRVLRQFLVENVLLTAAGGLAALMVASWLLDALLAMVPFQLSSSAPIGLNLPVLFFTFGVAIVTNLIISVVPFLSMARMTVYQSLKSGDSGGLARQRTRSLLVAGEVALSVTLLVSAALLIQSLYRLHQEQLGFSPKDVMTFRTPVPPELRGKEIERRELETRLLERIRAMPGIHSVAAINALPLTGQNNLPTQREGHPEQSIGGMEIRAVTPGYFETMGIPIVRGRAFSDTDSKKAPPVVLVSERVAEQWWAQDDPLGDRVVIGRFRGRDVGAAGSDSPREVVGVVADTKSVRLKERPRFTVYVPAGQWMTDGMSWVMRGNFPAGFAEQLRQAVREVDPRQRVERVRTMDSIVALTTADSRFDAWLFGIFAGVALVLTAVGVYGLLAFSVARRTKEIGMRMALGASRRHVLTLVLRQGVTLVVIGLVAGLAGARALSGLLSNLLFGVGTTDRFTYVAVGVVLFTVGILASYLPARRATKVDPMVALRTD